MIHRRRSATVAIACIAAIWGVGSSAHPQPVAAIAGRLPLTEADVSDTIESPSLAIDSAGSLYVTWASETAAGERTVLFASAPPGGDLSLPRVVARTGIFVAESSVGRGAEARTVRRALRTGPHVAVVSSSEGRESIVVVFTDARADDVGSVRPMLVQSFDGGLTFSEPGPLGEASAVRPTFTGSATTPDGRLLFSWLDHRLGVQVPALAATAPGQLTFHGETLLESGVGPRGVCPCCPTACAGDDAGDVYLAFRNQADGFRDVFVGRRAADARVFGSVAAVVPPTWSFDGCPHDGPTIDVHGGLLTVAWMDAHEGMPRVYVSTSRTGRLDFAQAVRLDPRGQGAQGNPRIRRDATGVLHAVWERSIVAEQPVAGVPQVSSPARGVDGVSDRSPAGSTSRESRSTGRHEHTTDGGGGRLVVHARLVDGDWTDPEPLTETESVIQSRPAIACGRSGGTAVAWFERSTDGKSLVVARISAPGDTAVADAGRVPRASRRMAAGHLAYLQHCAGCHGATGTGDGPAAVALQQPPRSFASAAWRGPRSRDGIRRAIVEGVSGTAMKPAVDLEASSLDALVEHVAALARLPAGNEAILVEHDPPLTVAGFAARDAGGRDWQPSRDHLTLVHVWGESCSACLAEMPAIESLGVALADRGLEVVHLCADQADGVAAEEVARSVARSARVLVDPSGIGVERLGVRVLPAVRLVDDAGRIVASLDGSGDWKSERMRAAVMTLLERSRRRASGDQPAPPGPP